MAKVAFLTNTRERAEFMIGLAPPELEITLVDSTLPDDEKIPLCRDADVIVMIPAEGSVNLIRNCPKLKLIQTLSAGYDRLDVGAIGEMGIPIANNGGANAIAVAEQTVALMIAVSKKLMVQWHSAVNERAWRGDMTGMNMMEVTGKTVGIVGLGRVGKQVAKRLKGFDTETIYYDIVERPEEVQRDLDAHPVAFGELLGRSDIVSLHVPLTPRTRGMVGESELEMMKPTAFLVSTCRGPVVDEAALYQALKNQRIAGAGLDVLEEEPTPADNPLFELDNVVITPHLAGLTYETFVRSAEFAYANIKRVMAGETPESLITPDY